MPSKVVLNYANIATRRASRVLVIDPHYKVLLFEYLHAKTKPDALSDKGSYFTLPGGKAKPHESFWECAMRELKEETGISTPRISPKIVAVRKAPMLLPSGTIVAAHEQYFSVKLDNQPIIDRLEWTLQEKSTIQRWHWLNKAQIENLVGKNLWPSVLPEILMGAINDERTKEYISTREQIGDLIVEMETPD